MEQRNLEQQDASAQVTLLDTVFPILAEPRAYKDGHQVPFEGAASPPGSEVTRDPEFSASKDSPKQSQSEGLHYHPRDASARREEGLLVAVLEEVGLQNLMQQLREKKLGLKALCKVADDVLRWRSMVEQPLGLSRASSATFQFAVFIYSHHQAAIGTYLEFREHWQRLLSRGWTTMDSFRNASSDVYEFQEFLRAFSPGEIIEYEYLAEQLRLLPRGLAHEEQAQASFRVSV